uniref:Uncharacterized protein n=1 Tax=Zea mays TaxID=4577 RepID=C4J5E0_MAIZE|nr:unknown [Zea mays]
MTHDEHADAATERFLRVHRLDLRPVDTHGHDLVVNRVHGGDRVHAVGTGAGGAPEAAGLLVEAVDELRRLVQDVVVLMHEGVAHHLCRRRSSRCRGCGRGRRLRRHLGRSRG